MIGPAELSTAQAAIVGAPIDFEAIACALPDGLELPAIDVQVDETPRTEHLQANRQQRAACALDGMTAPSLVGYAAVYYLDFRWWAYHETDGLICGPDSHLTREDALATIYGRVRRDFQTWTGMVAWRFNGDRVTPDRWSRDQRPVIRSGGVHRTLGPEPAKGERRGMLGHGGREFAFEMLTGDQAGETITSHNVWHQGVIPAEFRALLPDNARQVETEVDRRMREHRQQQRTEQVGRAVGRARALLLCPAVRAVRHRERVARQQQRDERDAVDLAQRWADHAYRGWLGTWGDLAEPMFREWEEVLAYEEHLEEMWAEYRSMV